MNKTILHSLFCALLLSFGLTAHAQVTIGSSLIPNEGALLDLKEKDNAIGGETATKGLLMPRVSLSDLTPTTDADFAASIGATGTYNISKLIGLIVYNVNKVETPANRICPGIHVWDGTAWRPLKTYPDWSSSTPTVVSVTKKKLGTIPANDPSKPLGHLGYLEDIRGPLSDPEYNNYAYARLYNNKIEIEIRTTYSGQNPYACDENIVNWTETTGTETTYDEGIFMTHNMNTRYFPDNTPINGGIPSATTNYSVAQFAYPGDNYRTGGQYWDRQQGLLYNYKAAVNQDVGHNSEIGIVHPIRQGICPTGWHVPSDVEYQALLQALDASPDATQMKSSTILAGSYVTRFKGTSASADRGGFNALLTGCAYKGNSGVGYGNYVHLWSSSAFGKDRSRSWNADTYTTRMNPDAVSRDYLYSVRCKKD